MEKYIEYQIIQIGTNYPLGRSAAPYDVDKYGHGLTPVGFWQSGELFEEFVSDDLKCIRKIAKSLKLKDYYIEKKVTKIEITKLKR